MAGEFLAPAVPECAPQPPNGFSVHEVFDDLLSRFLLILPEEEVTSSERLYFHIEEAYWFYCDFFYESDRTLPQHSLSSFADEVFARAPWLLPNGKSAKDLYLWFMSYKLSVPVCGVIVFNEDMTKVLMIQHWNSEQWSFPRGKIAREESKLQCAVRELWEETGFDASAMLSADSTLSVREASHDVTMFVVRGVPEHTRFQPQTRKEVRTVAWHHLSSLPHLGSSAGANAGHFTRVKHILKTLSQRLKHLRGTLKVKQKVPPALATAVNVERGNRSPEDWTPLPISSGLGDAPEASCVGAAFVESGGGAGSESSASDTPPPSPGLSASSSDGPKAYPEPADFPISKEKREAGPLSVKMEWRNTFPQFSLDVEGLLSCFD